MQIKFSYFEKYYADLFNAGREYACIFMGLKIRLIKLMIGYL